MLVCKHLRKSLFHIFVSIGEYINRDWSKCENHGWLSFQDDICLNTISLRNCEIVVNKN